MVLKIQKLSFWDWRWELVPFSRIQRGVGTALCVGQVFGVTQQQEAALLFLSLPETWEFGNCFGGREGTGRKWLLSLCPSLPIETASLAPQASPARVTSACLYANHPQICHPVAEEIVGCSALVFSGARIQFCASCWEELHRSGFGVTWGSHVSSPCAWQEKQHPSWKVISAAGRVQASYCCCCVAVLSHF